MYSTFANVNASLRLAWKHKKLWVFALLVAGGLSFNSGSSNSNRNKDSSSDTPRETPQQQNIDLYDLEQNAEKKVLGTSTGMMAPIDETRTNSIQNRVAPADVLTAPRPPVIPVAQIVIIVADLLVLMLFGIFVNLFVNAWATGSFIKGLGLAIDDKAYTFRDLAVVGRQKVASLVKFSLFTSLLSLLAVLPLVGVGIWTAVSAIKNSPSFSPAPILVTSLAYVPLMALFIIAVHYITIFAIRHIVFKEMGVKEAFSAGWGTFKENLGRALKLTFANCLVQAVIGIALLISLGLIIGILAAVAFGVGTVLKEATALLVILGILVGTPLLIAVLLALSALAGFSQTYNGFTWSHLFNYSEYERSTRTAK